MKKTIFGFVCTILMGCAFASCNGAANATKASAGDSTEVVDDSVSADSADSAAVDSAAVDSVA